MLLAGRVEPDHADQFGRLLGTMHRRAQERRADLPLDFDDALGLRVAAPRALLRVRRPARARGARLPARSWPPPPGRGASPSCTATTAPKNVLVHEDRLVLLDHEVIHLGDPAFDLGFGLTHLLSKAHHLPREPSGAGRRGARHVGGLRRGARRGAVACGPPGARGPPRPGLPAGPRGGALAARVPRRGERARQRPRRWRSRDGPRPPSRSSWSASWRRCARETGRRGAAPRAGDAGVTPAPSSAVADVRGREILDSRGRPTVAARCALASGAVGPRVGAVRRLDRRRRGHRAARRRPARYRGLGCRDGGRPPSAARSADALAPAGLGPGGARRGAARPRRHAGQVAPGRQRDPRRLARLRPRRARPSAASRSTALRRHRRRSRAGRAARA